MFNRSIIINMEDNKATEEQQKEWEQCWIDMEEAFKYLDLFCDKEKEKKK